MWDHGDVVSTIHGGVGLFIYLLTSYMVSGHHSQHIRSLPYSLLFDTYFVSKSHYHRTVYIIRRHDCSESADMRWTVHRDRTGDQ